MTALINVLFLGSLFLVAAYGQDWSYAGADTWAETYPTCNGQRQSPINIVTTAVSSEGCRLVNFNWQRTTTNMNTTTTNTGYTVEYISDRMGESIDIGSVRYNLYKILYHWGSDASKGSEHSIDGKFYSGEAQFLHYKASYGSYEDAKDKDDGLAFVAILLQQSDTLQVDNIVLDGFKKMLAYVLKPGGKLDLEFKTNTIETRDLIPAEDTSYFTYDGSLTTPPCSENVKWVVFKTPLQVTKTYLDVLRSVQKTEAEKLLDNFRPSCPSNHSNVCYLD